ncbi:hypothetical protein FB471_3455 [Amycolatopsis cihanbeyliensis]|uniref:Uncharacterized protein n=1 Tax=Amycolatopsis cihanbeyliensis TaxID=1128664 RepID=A0A542DKS0_AMYCI|nr:hypothetical protein FB471_3455 [Amycolatopsis cihanbeyliensis]
MAFNAQWTPGPNAVAGMHINGSRMPPVGLVVYLDPDSLAILPPTDPMEWPGFVRLLHQLSDGCQDMAAFLENGAERTCPPG